MKKFKIFVSPQGTSEAVKVGWSWPAFFFNFIWPFVKGLYPLGIGLIVGSVVVGKVIRVSGITYQAHYWLIRFISIVVMIIFGANGNKWRERNLQKRGFNLKDTVSAISPKNAISLYLKHGKSQPSSSENLTKKCPACAETIKLEAKKCRYCGEEIDLEDTIDDSIAKHKEGKKQCPECKKWDVYQTMTKNYGMSDYCPHCKKALLDIEMLSV